MEIRESSLVSVNGKEETQLVTEGKERSFEGKKNFKFPYLKLVSKLVDINWIFPFTL